MNRKLNNYDFKLEFFTFIFWTSIDSIDMLGLFPMGVWCIYPWANFRILSSKIDFCKRRNFRAVHIFAHFAQGFRSRKFDVSKNYNQNRTNRNKQHMRENLTARICVIGLDARKFSCAKISTFTVYRAIDP